MSGWKYNRITKSSIIERPLVKVKVEDVENIDTSDDIIRDDIYRVNDKFYRVLSVFKISYNKWRLERSGKRNDIFTFSCYINFLKQTMLIRVINISVLI